MKIAYVTTYDATDIKQWSGLGYFIYKKLDEKGVNVQLISNLKVKNKIFHKLKQLLYKIISGKSYRIDRNPSVVNHFSTEIKARLDADCELVFALSSIPVARLRIKKPVVFYTDATVDIMRTYYPEYKSFCSETYRQAEQLEKEAIQNCDLMLYSSQWAAKSAIQHYGGNPDKIKVIPFGANTQSNLDEREVRKIISKRDKNVLKLLFIGVYWQRKGGDIALEVADLLNRCGIKTELHLLGRFPREKWPDFVVNHGFINKSTPEGINHFNNIISNSHFLILPSRADCTPIVFSEANSFGLPCISTKTGGIPEIIREGKNGFTFGLDKEADAYAKKIQELFTNRKAYEQLAIDSFFEYKNRLNWDVSIQKLVREMEYLIPDKTEL